MRKPLLLSISLFLSFVVVAQTVSVTPNPKHEEGFASTPVIQADVIVKNESDQELNLLWKRHIISAPHGWLSQICDERLCYLPEVSECPEAYPNNLLPGEEITMRVDILPQGVPGEGEIHVDLFDITDPDNILATIVATFSTTTTSVDDHGKKEDLKLYPNPTSEYFRINNPAQVSRLQMYNIVGNAVREYRVSTDASYPVGDLPQGIYLVRLYDHQNHVLKTVRLSKR